MKRELLIGVYTRVKAFVKWSKKNVKDGFCNKKQQKTTKKKTKRKHKIRKKKRRRSKRTKMRKS